MIRGRRGIAVVVLFFIAILLARPAKAWELGMTATVPLSPTWKALIEEHSSVTLDTRSHRNIAKLSLVVKGTDNITLPEQTVQALLFQGSTLIDNQIRTTDKKGNVDFTFVYKIEDSYRILVIDATDDSPFVIRSIQF